MARSPGSPGAKTGWALLVGPSAHLAGRSGAGSASLRGDVDGWDGGRVAVEQGPEFAVDVAVVVGRRRKAARSPAAIREISWSRRSWSVVKAAVANVGVAACSLIAVPSVGRTSIGRPAGDWSGM